MSEPGFLTHGLGFFPNETMEFTVALAGVDVGVASLAVSELTTAAPPNIVVSSHIESSGMAALLTSFLDDSSTTIDAQSGQPIAMRIQTMQNRTRFETIGRFAGTTATLEYRKQSDPPRQIAYDLKDTAPHDTHSAMAALRLWRPTPNETRTSWVIGGRRLWRVQVTFVGTDVIGTEAGNRRALRIRGEAARANASRTLDTTKPPRTFEVWLSDDADRVPLRVVATTDFGNVQVSLTDYQRPLA